MMAHEKGLVRRERPEMEQMEPWNTFRDMERMFRNFFSSPFPFRNLSYLLPSEITGAISHEVDLKETDKDITLSAEIPGLEKDDIDIDVTKDTINISGERKMEEEKPGEKYHFRHRSYGSFNISYALPSNVKPEEVKATYKNGVLEVMMPKAEVTEAHKVSVETE